MRFMQNIAKAVLFLCCYKSRWHVVQTLKMFTALRSLQKSSKKSNDDWDSGDEKEIMNEMQVSMASTFIVTTKIKVSIHIISIIQAWMQLQNQQMVTVGSIYLTILDLGCIQCRLWQSGVPLLQAWQKTIRSIGKSNIFISISHQVFNCIPWWLWIIQACFSPPYIHWGLNAICNLKSFMFGGYV